MSRHLTHALGGIALTLFLTLGLAAQSVMPTSITTSPSPTCTANGSETHTVCITLPPGTSTTEVDVFLLFDDTGSFASSVPATIAVFNQIVTDLQTALPSVDFAFGVGRFEDYGGPGASFTAGDFETTRPFILNQAIIRASTPGFLAAINAALANTAPGNGGDSPESAIGEGLFQIATGVGFDGNNDGDTTDSGNAGDLTTQTAPGTSGDVPAFSTYTGVADGTQGGVGFRPGALKLVLLATDICAVATFDAATGVPANIIGTGSTEPVSAFACSNTTPGNSRFGFVSDSPDTAGNTILGAVAPLGAATVQETVTALNGLGVRVIGLTTVGSATSSTAPSFSPATYLSALARLTGAVDNLGDPLVFNISGGATPVANAIVNAVTTTTTADVDIILTADPAQPGLAVSTVPPIQMDVSPGDTVCFDVTFTGDGTFAGGNFDLNFRDQASNSILNNIPTALLCPPHCVPPTPSVELGFECVPDDPPNSMGTAILNGLATISYPIVAEAGATIVGVTAEQAPFVGGGDCGTFVPAAVPPGLTHVSALAGSPNSTTATWDPTLNSEVGCWRFTYTLENAEGTQGTCTVVVKVLECLVLVGFEQAAEQVSPNDMLLVAPYTARGITLTSIPSFYVPNNPALIGFKVFFQTFMSNADVFPGDPLRMSNGLEIQIGVGNTIYGTGSGMNLWLTDTVIMPGDHINISFSIAGF